MTKKNIIIALIIVVVIILAFILTRDNTAAPTTETPVDVQSEVNKLKENQNVSNNPAAKQITDSQSPQVQGAATTNNNSNTQTPMQLEIKTTQEGTGAAVKAGDTVDVKYTGKLIDGTVFDATDKHGGAPFSFTVGVGQVIKGWDQGLLGMKVGEKRTLTIPSDLGYGPQGMPGAIPPNATLIFDIELVAIK